MRAGSHTLTDRLCDLATRPLAFPDRSDKVAMFVERIVFLLTQGKDIIHGTIEEPGMRFVALQKGGRVTMPETPIEFVDGLGRRIKPVDGVTSVGSRCTSAPLSACRMGVTRRPPHINNCSQLMVLAWRQWVCKYRLQANAIVIWSKGSSPALASNSPLNVIQPCFRSRTSDFQYSRSSRRKSNT